ARAHRRDEPLQPGGPGLRTRRGAPEYRAPPRGGRGGPARGAAHSGARRPGRGGDRASAGAREAGDHALLPRGAHHEGGGRRARVDRVARLAAPLAGDAASEAAAQRPLRRPAPRGETLMPGRRTPRPAPTAPADEAETPRPAPGRGDVIAEGG